MPATPLARPWTVVPGKAASSDQAAHGAHEAPGSARLRACFLGARGAIGGTSDARGAGRFVGFVGSLGGGVANPLASNPLTDNPLSCVLVDTVIRPLAPTLAPVLVSRYAARLVGLGATLGLAIGLPAGGQATRCLGVAVGWSEVRAAAVVPGVCARVAGRVRLHRSEGLKTSHGSRLFMGEGPTGEDNAARAAGPPTG
ncbi:hypothetical protein ACFVTF_17530 [Kitasatospora sp. NPDC057940]|uniref:hypothetical protein n=1 Tax=Kitasatospora sp. NPDC057940 TaxID=3346285 RepID=UPI0036D9B0F1